MVFSVLSDMSNNLRFPIFSNAHAPIHIGVPFLIPPKVRASIRKQPRAVRKVTLLVYNEILPLKSEFDEIRLCLPNTGLIISGIIFEPNSGGAPASGSVNVGTYSDTTSPPFNCSGDGFYPVPGTCSPNFYICAGSSVGSGVTY